MAADELAKLFSSPTIHPLEVDVEHDEYPFLGFEGREPEIRQIKQWILDGVAFGQLHAGALLVTGFRGVGKSVAVAKVLFDLGIAQLYGENAAVVSDAAKSDWGPFSRAELKKARAKPSPRGLIVPVHINLAGSLTPTALLRRIVRRTYFTLASYPIGEIDPAIMQRARVAFVRSLGELTADYSEKVTRSLGITPDKLGQLVVSYKDEMQFASALKLVSKELSVDDAEDELIEIAKLTSGRHREPHLVERIGKHTTELLKGLKKWAVGQHGIPLRLVYVFDELDKLPPAVSVDSEPTIDTLLDARAIVSRLKSMLTSTSTTSIVVGGVPLLEEWLREVRTHDPLLRSIFSRHVYVPQLTRAEIRQAILKVNSYAKSADVAGELTNKLDELTDFAVLHGRGRWKAVRRLQNELLTAEKLGLGFALPTSQFALAPMQTTLSKVLEDWGTVMCTPPKIDDASTVEVLAAYLVVGNQAPVSDCARALVCAWITNLRLLPPGALALQSAAPTAELEATPASSESNASAATSLDALLVAVADRLRGTQDEVQSEPGPVQRWMQLELKNLPTMFDQQRATQVMQRLVALLKDAK